MEFNIALVRGDGIGPEVIEETLNVLNRIGEIYNHKFNFMDVLAGGIAIDKTGIPLPEETIKICKSSDAVLLGAVGGPKWDNLTGDLRPERALLGLRQELQLYANLRPAVLHSSLIDACPLRADLIQDGIDIMVVRELTGGMYFGDKGRKQTELGEAAWDTEMYSVSEVERICRTAFEIATLRKNKVTNVDKANVLESSRLWRSVFLEVAKDYPNVTTDHLYIDNATMQIITRPSTFDVIVTSNMFGDILSDEASQITGSIGMLPSASLNKSSLGMFEPIHGSAPDIAGQDIANPIATILSAAMMFQYSFKLDNEAKSIEKAVSDVLAEGYRTADIYSEGSTKIGTKEMGKRILDKLQ